MMRINNLMRRLRRGDSGIASVELAMVLPLLALMLFGTIDIGRLLFDYHAVSKSVRDATRFLARSDGGPAPAGLAITCPGETVDQTSTPAMNGKRLAMTGTIDGSGDNVVKYWTDLSTITISVDCVTNDGVANDFQGFYFGIAQVPAVVMSADVSFSFMNGWLLDRGSSLTFTITHKEPHIGQ